MPNHQGISQEQLVARIMCFVSTVTSVQHRHRFKDGPRFWILYETKETKRYLVNPVTFFDQIGVEFKDATKVLGGARKWKKSFLLQAESFGLKVYYALCSFLFISASILLIGQCDVDTKVLHPTRNNIIMKSKSKAHTRYYEAIRVNAQRKVPITAPVIMSTPIVAAPTKKLSASQQVPLQQPPQHPPREKRCLWQAPAKPP
jgi:hypothetical protein